MKYLLILITLLSATCALADSDLASEKTEKSIHQTFDIEKLAQDHPKILYFTDTNHLNTNLRSVYTEIVTQIVQRHPQYNCILLEGDKKIFQPAIDQYLNGQKSWQDSVGQAQSYWEQITGRPYKVAQEPFLKRLKELGLKVFAVDWSDESPNSNKMKKLFKLGFAGDSEALEQAFHYGIEIRNSVIAENISQLFKDQTESGKGEPPCERAIMSVGALHLASEIDMGLGTTQYTSIADFPTLAQYTQKAHEILDCRELNNTNSVENQTQCNQTNWLQLSAADIFSEGNSIDVVFAESESRTSGIQTQTSPQINWNIMIPSKQ